ncbi:hypothetical protein RF55_15883 [Lasius niger]|uniref:Uncharacterized protein n=1 Tax=Lasius niger TaxID=67767 RepID=A0A0J7K5P0_LASNI|nr:hypothetical protein RF55_15883 [Lasius niger]
MSLVSEALMQRLRLRRVHSDVPIIGIGDTPSGSTRGKVTLALTSCATGTKLSAVAIILPRLSAYRGPTTRCSNDWPHLQGLQLADPQFSANDPVELLLGAEVYPIIFQEGLRKGGPEVPFAQKTILGWILSGGCGVASLHARSSSLQCTVDHDLTELVHRFWEQEKEPVAPVALKPEEERCEEFFARTHKRTKSGRYLVRLPFSAMPTSLAETRRPAERLLTAME